MQLPPLPPVPVQCCSRTFAYQIIYLWCDGCCDLMCECRDELEQRAVTAEAEELETENRTQLSEAVAYQATAGMQQSTKPQTDVLCQGLGANAFHNVRSWASQESLLKKYCSGSCRKNRSFQDRNMCIGDAAMYTVLAIRRRLTSAAKDLACACSSCNMTAEEEAVKQIYIDEVRHIESHKVKFEPVLQQLLYDLHYFENRHVIQHASMAYTLTYSQIQPWNLCSCPHCLQCQNKVANEVACPVRWLLRLNMWMLQHSCSRS